MKITLRNSVKPSIRVERNLPADRNTRVVFLTNHEAMAVCRELFGSAGNVALYGIGAKDEDGDDYLVLLR